MPRVAPLKSIKMFLVYKNLESWEKLVDITGIPDLQSAPEMLDGTTCSDEDQINYFGIRKRDGFEFPCFYVPADEKKVEALKDKETEFGVWFGGTDSETPTGDDIKKKFKGYATYLIKSTDVNNIVNAAVYIATTSPVTTDET